MGLSIRAYAAQRGVSHTAVRKAISSGRLILEPDGTIDQVKADRDWEQNADPSKRREAPKLKPVPTAAVGAVRDTLSEAGAPIVGGMSYLHARTAEKVLTVQLLREKLRREKGEVVERDYAIEQGFAFARHIAVCSHRSLCQSPLASAMATVETSIESLCAFDNIPLGVAVDWIGQKSPHCASSIAWRN
jgi:hypothetical protein